MTAYLIAWKPATENPVRGWPEDNLTRLAADISSGRAAREAWRFHRREGVELGARVFLVQQGRRGHAILGYGRITALPTAAEPRQTTVTFDALVDPRSGVAFASTDELRSISAERSIWGTMASGIALPEDVSLALEKLVVGR